MLTDRELLQQALDALLALRTVLGTLLKGGPRPSLNSPEVMAHDAICAIRAHLAQPTAEPVTEEYHSRGMFVARMESMIENGNQWLTATAVLALLDDYDMLALREKEAHAAGQRA